MPAFALGDRYTWQREAIRMPRIETLPPRRRYSPRLNNDGWVGCLVRLLREDEVARALWAAL